MVVVVVVLCVRATVRACVQTIVALQKGWSNVDTCIADIDTCIANRAGQPLTW
jgi:hypothetical protein